MAKTTKRLHYFVNRYTDWFAILGFVLITILATYPTVFHLGTMIFGYPGDSWLWSWMAWWRKYSLMHGLEWRYLPLTQAPFGTDHAFHPYHGLILLLAGIAYLTNEIVAYNVMRLLAMTLAMLFTYFLVKHLTNSRSGAFLGAIIYAFSARAVLHYLNHVDQSQLWIIPLFMLLLIRLKENPSIGNALLLGVTFGLTAYIHAYYAYHCTIAAIAFLGYDTVDRIRHLGWHNAFDKRQLAMYGLAGSIGTLIFLPELLSIYRELAGIDISPLRPLNTLRRPDIWFFELSNRPWDYFIPPGTHPILGGIGRYATEQIGNLRYGHFAPRFLEERFNLDPHWYWRRALDPTGNDQYLGYINLALSIFAFIQWRLDRLEIKGFTVEKQETGLNYWLGYFVVVFLTGFLFSQPPYLPIGALLGHIWKPLYDVVLPTPSLLSMTIAQPLRNVRRFVLLMMLALSIFSGLGLSQIRSKFQQSSRKLAVTLGVFALLTFDYAFIPHTTPFDVPIEYSWLAEQPPGTTTAIYPLDQRSQLIYQIIHEQPLTDGIASIDGNFTKDNLFEIQKMSVGSLQAPDAGPKLAAMEVQIAINTDEPLTTPPEGFEFAFSTETAQVFRVNADPAPLVVLHTLREGLWQSDADWAWQAREFRVYVWNPLNNAKQVDVVLPVSTGVSNKVVLEAERTLTPYPQQIIWSGITLDNPNIPPDYPTAPVVAELTAADYRFQRLVFQPGETVLTLRWASLLDNQLPPLITNILFVVHDPPPVWPNQDRQ